MSTGAQSSSPIQILDSSPDLIKVKFPFKNKNEDDPIPEWNSDCYTILEDNTTQRPYKCRDCLKTFKTLTTIYRHFNAIHRRAYQCPQCKFCFSRKELLEKHQPELCTGNKRKREEESPDVMSYMCIPSLFGSSTVKVNEFDESYLANGEGGDSQGESPEVSPEESPMVNPEESPIESPEVIPIENLMETPEESPEVSQGKNVKRTVCSTCTRTFSTNKLYNTHLKACTFKQDLTCSSCEKQFKGKKHLQNHMEQYSDGNCPYKSYECTVCQKALSNLYLLQSHMKKVHKSIWDNTGLLKSLPKKVKVKYDDQSNIKELEEEPLTQEMKGLPSDSEESVEPASSSSSGNRTSPATSNASSSLDAKAVKKEKVTPKANKKMRTSLGDKVMVGESKPAFGCQECGLKFSSMVGFTQHCYVVHMNQSLPHKCSHCEYRVKDKSALVKHLVARHSDKEKKQILKEISQLLLTKSGNDQANENEEPELKEFMEELEKE